ncbi:MAG: hypothetical protein AABY22_15710, partial [Nanoarchaeota archaeon]
KELQVDNIDEDLRSSILRGLEIGIQDKLSLVGGTSNISASELAKRQLDNLIKPNDETLIGKLEQIFPEIQSSNKNILSTSANLAITNTNFDRFIKLAEGPGIKATITNFKELKELPTEKLTGKIDYSAIGKAIDAGLKKLDAEKAGKVVSPEDVTIISKAVYENSIRNKLKQFQSLGGHFIGQNNFGIGLPENIPQTGLDVASRTTQTPINKNLSFQDEFGIKFNPNNLPFVPSVRQTKDLNVTGGSKIDLAKVLVKSAQAIREGLNANLSITVSQLEEMVKSGTSFNDEISDAVEKINEINIKLGNFENVDFKEAFFGPLRYGIKEFTRDLEKGLRQTSVDFKDGLKSALGELVRGKGKASDIFREAALSFLYKQLDQGINLAINNVFGALSKLVPQRTGQTALGGSNSTSNLIGTFGGILAGIAGSFSGGRSSLGSTQYV